MKKIKTLVANPQTGKQLVDKDVRTEAYAHYQGKILGVKKGLDRVIAGTEPCEITFMLEMFEIYNLAFQWMKNNNITGAERVQIEKALDEIARGINNYYMKEQARGTMRLKPLAGGKWRVVGDARFPMLGIPDYEINDKIKLYLYDLSESLRQNLIEEGEKGDQKDLHSQVRTGIPRLQRQAARPKRVLSFS